MVEVLFHNQLFVAVHVNVAGAVIAYPSQEHVAPAANLAHPEMLPPMVTYVKQAA
jgi:hypothetical protein